MNKRQKSAVETKRKLISAGLELIKEKGFDAINVEDITKKPVLPRELFILILNAKKILLWKSAEHHSVKLLMKLSKWKTLNCLTNSGIIFAVLWNRLNFVEFKSAVNAHVR